jgi:hypothetical protein
MTSAAKPIPDGRSAATPYLCVKRGTAAIEDGSPEETQKRAAGLFSAS